MIDCVDLGKRKEAKAKWRSDTLFIAVENNTELYRTRDIDSICDSAKWRCEREGAIVSVWKQIGYYELEEV